MSRQSSGGSSRSTTSSTPREKKRFSAFSTTNEFDLSHELKTAILESDKALIQAAKKANDVAGNLFQQLNPTNLIIFKNVDRPDKRQQFSLRFNNAIGRYQFPISLIMPKSNPCQCLIQILSIMRLEDINFQFQNNQIVLF